jgi:transcriptional regulator, AbrB family
LTIRVKVGKKGYIVLPKLVRELVGIKENEELILRVEEGRVVLEPEKKVELSELRKRIHEHLKRISYVKTKPKLGELKNVALEDEFEDVS